MTTLHEYLADEHRACDAHYLQAEAHIADRDWEAACDAFGRFACALEQHLRGEEALLFPAMEKVLGSGAGPTAVMRMEHQHIRVLVQRMADAIDAHDANACFDHADSLRILMHQHNLKEENVLYPTALHLLGASAQPLLEQLRRQWEQPVGEAA
ncbi:hemerythrin domain-containing protein [Pseudoduganella armeniaca]|uniref:Hemerythrin domain-containing protein n=1 Tax=Pseudoduganella armeniaca TaxID=2072590 RepID=A0A2R4CC41_9BURK|nr:hemerythrin domain-containing protein [Pseudoduganella armeniaca]AVR97058.1 hemerythrin domain-containing protein [Pseudoduganella armeniaca]